MPREFKALAFRCLKYGSLVRCKVYPGHFQCKVLGSLDINLGLDFLFLRVVWDNNLNALSSEIVYQAIFKKHLLSSHFSMYESPVKWHSMTQWVWEGLIFCVFHKFPADARAASPQVILEVVRQHFEGQGSAVSQLCLAYNSRPIQFTSLFPHCVWWIKS